MAILGGLQIGIPFGNVIGETYLRGTSSSSLPTSGPLPTPKQPLIAQH